MFPHDKIQVIHFSQECHRADILCPSVHRHQEDTDVACSRVGSSIG